MPYVADERQMLGAFLDAARLAIRGKLDGLSDEQARSTPTASSLSLLGVVKHLAWTECRWFRGSFADEEIDDPLLRGDAVFEFTVTPTDTVESVLALYDEQCNRSRAIVAHAASLDAPAANRRFANEISLRWIIVHMIEETARHAGHADVIRESIDGTTGD